VDEIIAADSEEQLAGACDAGFFDQDLQPAAGQSVVPRGAPFAEWSVSLPHLGASRIKELNALSL